jgi:hypothetical protein
LGRRIVSSGVSSEDRAIRLRYLSGLWQNPALSWLAASVLWRPLMALLSFCAACALFALGVLTDVFKDERLKPVARRWLGRAKLVPPPNGDS